MFEKYKKYVRDNPSGYWFKRKWYGWGWTPVKWQGWMATLLYVIGVLIFALTIDENSPASEIFFTGIFPIVLLTILFIRIAYRKGESPKWQWGTPDEDQGKPEA